MAVHYSAVSGRLQLANEEEAAGVVSSVFLDVRARMPFVPAIFRALAADPPALEAAWVQARQLYDAPGAAAAAEQLREAARTDLRYVPSSAVRETVEPFRADLPSMLLIVTSLGLALDGVLERRPRPPASLPPPGALPPSPVPEDRGEQPLYDEIRRVYGTAHLPSIYRALGARGLLAEPWEAVGPYLASKRGELHVGAVAAAAAEEALAFPEVACFDAESARAVLAQFRAALPRNLIFVSAASRAA
jgi:hypothetical protein